MHLFLFIINSIGVKKLNKGVDNETFDCNNTI
jgi:hypothetical protein